MTLAKALGQQAVNRFFSHVDKQEGCWAWRGGSFRDGYGQYCIKGQWFSVHRLAYELLVGPIPAGLVLDHLCHNQASACLGGASCSHRRCVNPAHLEPVPASENCLRGVSFAAVNARKTHCVAGHPFDEANTYIDPKRGVRHCRACNRRRVAAYKARAKGARRDRG